MAARRDPAYPPHVRLVNLLFDGKDEEQVIAESGAVEKFLGEQLGGARDVDLLGPAPQPLSKLKGKHRWHLTLRGGDHRRLRELALAVLDRPTPLPRGVRLTVDVDPVSLL
jgi:primosomal protein N' (replication factor Y)